jgi:hypothetical protein
MFINHDWNLIDANTVIHFALLRYTIGTSDIQRISLKIEHLHELLNQQKSMRNYLSNRQEPEKTC